MDAHRASGRTDSRIELRSGVREPSTTTRYCIVEAVVPIACGFAGGWHSRPYIDGGSSRSCLEGFAFLDRTSTKAHSGFSEQKKIRTRAATSEKGEGSQRQRTRSLRSKLHHDPGRKMEDARALSSLARLVHALGEKGIRFQIVGMSAAILQGISGSPQGRGASSSSN